MNPNSPPNLTNHQPLIFNPLTGSSNEGLITPGSPQFVVTDDGLYVETDDSQFVITG